MSGRNSGDVEGQMSLYLELLDSEIRIKSAFRVRIGRGYKDTEVGHGGFHDDVGINS